MHPRRSRIIVNCVAAEFPGVPFGTVVLVGRPAIVPRLRALVYMKLVQFYIKLMQFDKQSRNFGLKACVRQLQLDTVAFSPGKTKRVHEVFHP